MAPSEIIVVVEVEYGVVPSVAGVGTTSQVDSHSTLLEVIKIRSPNGHNIISPGYCLCLYNFYSVAER